MRKRAFLALLLTLLFVAGIALGDGAQTALEKGYTLKTTVTCEWNGAGLVTDAAAEDALESVLENSKWVLKAAWPQDGAGRLYSVDWQLMEASVLDWTGMLLDGGWWEQSNLFGGRSVALSDLSALRAADLNARQSAAVWKEAALQWTLEPLGDMMMEIAVITGEEMTALAETLCAAWTENETLWQPAALTGALGAEGVLLLENMRSTLKDIPQKISGIMGDDGAVIICIDYDVQGNVVLRQADAMLLNGQIHAEWTLADDGELGTLSVQGAADGMEIFLTLERTAGSKKAANFALRLAKEGRALTLDGTCSASGSGKNYSRRGQLAVSVATADGAGGKLLTLTSRTTALDQKPLRPDEAAEIVFPAELEAEALEAFLLQTRQDAMQTLFTVIGRLPEKAADYLQARMGIE